MDFKVPTRNVPQVDRAIEAASRSLEDLTFRFFYPMDDTRYFDWPNYQLSPPWRLWLDKNELAAPATAILSGTTNIPIADVNFEPFDYGPPFKYIELRRDKTDSFGHNTTPQRDVAITGTYGFWTKTEQRGTLVAAITTTNALTLTVSDGSIATGVDVGDILVIDTERMLVTAKTWTTSGQTQQTSGAGTASLSDQALSVVDGTQFYPTEVILLDSEQMYITGIVGNVLTVNRAWAGSTLATHSSATINVNRLCTVTRGDLGTTAATHLISAPVNRYQIPGLARSLTIAEAINFIEQETSGYARTMGSADNVRAISGAGLQDLRDRVSVRLGRSTRQRAI
jgi:hypothetical protein